MWRSPVRCPFRFYPRVFPTAFQCVPDMPCTSVRGNIPTARMWSPGLRMLPFSFCRPMPIAGIQIPWIHVVWEWENPPVRPDRFQCVRVGGLSARLSVCLYRWWSPGCSFWYCTLTSPGGNWPSVWGRVAASLSGPLSPSHLGVQAFLSVVRLPGFSLPVSLLSLAWGWFLLPRCCNRCRWWLWCLSWYSFFLSCLFVPNVCLSWAVQR